MLFGLRNTAESFQNFTALIVRGLEFCFAYFDDFLVASVDTEQNKAHLLQFFGRLRKYRVLLNDTKRESGAAKLDYFELSPFEQGN